MSVRRVPDVSYFGSRRTPASPAIIGFALTWQGDARLRTGPGHDPEQACPDLIRADTGLRARSCSKRRCWTVIRFGCIGSRPGFERSSPGGDSGGDDVDAGGVD